MVCCFFMCSLARKMFYLLWTYSEQLVLPWFYTDQLLCSKRQNTIFHYGKPKSYLRETLKFRGYFFPGSSSLSSSALFRDNPFHIKTQLYLQKSVQTHHTKLFYIALLHHMFYFSWSSLLSNDQTGWGKKAVPAAQLQKAQPWSWPVCQAGL